MIFDGRKVRWIKYKKTLQKIIYDLLDECDTRNEICDVLGISRATLYKHLRIMRNQGILDNYYQKTDYNPYEL